MRLGLDQFGLGPDHGRAGRRHNAAGGPGRLVGQDGVVDELIAALLAGGLLFAGGGHALAAGEALHPPDTKFSFDGLFGTFDRASALRKLEAALDPAGHSTTIQAVLARIKKASESG